MARTDNLTNFLTDVAGAIRTKAGTSNQIPASDFDTAIANIPGADIDWTQLGYSAGTPQEIIDGYNYAKQIKDNWVKPGDMGSYFAQNRQLMFLPRIDTSGIDYSAMCFADCTSLIKVAPMDTSSMTDMNRFFSTCSSLKEIPSLDTHNNTSMYMFAINCYALEKVGTLDTHLVTNFYRAFFNDYSLTTVPVFDFSLASIATDLNDVFYNCIKLTDQSIDNILQSCITATSYQGSKRLATLGFSNRISSARIKACPHYQEFTDAGWVIGYN